MKSVFFVVIVRVLRIQIVMCILHLQNISNWTGYILSDRWP